MKRSMKKSKGSMPKALRGKLAQADTMADKPTMGNPGKRMKKARDKRLEKMAI
jgi:hypothetical protein